MEKKQAIVGLFVILAIIGVAVGINKAKKGPAVPLTLPSPSVTEEIQKTFNLTIPSDVEKTDLNKVGDVEGMGIVTRKWQNGKFELTVLADLPETETGAPYQVWLQKTSGEKLFLGDLRVAKGGYLLEFESGLDYSSYQKVIIATSKTNVLEGSF